MVKKITFLAKIIGIFFCTTIASYAIDLKIIPLKKPELSKEIKEEKILKSIIKPKKKPVNESEQGKKITWLDGIKSYFYLFKTRFIDNDISTQLSILLTLVYMSYIGSHFGMGIGKTFFIILTGIIGLFIGLHRKIASSSIIYLF